MSGLIEHAKKEFEVLGWVDLPEDDMQTWVVENLLELLEVFSKQGHSGSSAPYVMNLFNKLARYKPLSPLTGEEDEWGEAFESGGMQQNKRDSEVFRYANGKAYWGFGRVFTDGKSTYTGKGSRVRIKKFPWYKPEKPKLVHERWRWLFR